MSDTCLALLNTLVHEWHYLIYTILGLGSHHFILFYNGHVTLYYYTTLSHDIIFVTLTDLYFSMI